nr:putative ribonuclease H-like domain-containing protein [Tanacetum cinerariifolium]
MESLSPQVVSAAKLPILNPNELDLRKIRIEQHFLMTDYSLWEVILNARKNELKAHGTLLMALPDKHQLKFNTHKDAKNLMEAIEKSLKIYEAKVKSSSSASTTTQNIAFVSSSNTENTNEPVSAAASVSAIDDDDLEEMDLKWQMAMLTVECYNYHRKGHFARECRSPKDTKRNAMTRVFKKMRNLLTMLSWPSLLQVLLLTMRYQSGNGYHDVPPPYTGTFMPPKPDLIFNTAPNDVETDHSVFTVKLSPTKPDQDLSHTHRYSAPIIEDWVSDLEDESETKSPQNVFSFVQPTEQVKSPRPSVKHVETFILTTTPKTAILKPTCNGKCRNRKACFLVPITAVRPVSTAVPKIKVIRPTQDKPVVTKPTSPPRRHITHSPTSKASNFPLKVTAAKSLVVNAAQGVSRTWEWKPKYLVLDHVSSNTSSSMTLKWFDYNDALGRSNGFSRHMTGNMSYLSDFKELNGGYFAIGGHPKGGKISRKGKIRTGTLDFDDAYFINELKVNLFSVSKMCNKKKSVLFTETKCLVLSPEFKLPDENQVLLRVPRENNMYNVNLKNIILSGDLTCLFAKATLDESNLWHRRLSHINFKTMNKLVKGNIVRGLPSNVFGNNHTCVACKKGKQHRASCKTKPVSSVDQPLYRLHIDLFGPTFVKSLNKKSYCLVITDDYSRFTWVFFLATKDETSPILKTFITGLENQLSLKVKVIKSDNRTEFENNDLNQFYGMKGIKREFCVPKTPQQNGITERKNITLIEAARSMLVDLLLPISFWAEAVNTACYVQNRVLVTKHQNKTPYELLHGRTPSIGFMRPFGCPVTILNTLDSLENFDGKNTDGDATFDEKEPEFEERKPESEVNVSPSSSTLSKKHDDKTKTEAKGKIPAVGKISPNSTNTFSAASPSNAAASPTHRKSLYVDSSQIFNDPNMPELEDITYSDDEDDVGAEADFNNLETSITVCPIPTTRVRKDHPVTQIIRIYLQLHKQGEELLQFKMQKVWVLVDLPYRKRAIGTKWGFRNKKDERGIVVRNKAQLFAQGHTQEEGIDYEEVFALVVRIEAIRLFLAYAFFMGFMVYQMDVKSAFLYGTIEEEVYVCQPLGFEDLGYHDKVYKVVKALYGLHQAPRAWKFGLTDTKSARTPIDTEKPLLKDPDGEDVDVHTYRSMIGSLMYLTLSRPDIMFAVYACACFQVTPKASHLHAVKRIFRYLKGKLHLGLWYPKDSPFNLVAYSDSDYAGASLDRKSITKGCQLLGCRLISWQYKKETVMATSSTEAEYVDAAS